VQHFLLDREVLHPQHDAGFVHPLLLPARRGGRKRGEAPLAGLVRGRRYRVSLRRRIARMGGSPGEIALPRSGDIGL